MKAITLSDNSPKNPVPWLTMVQYGFKSIETRKFNTSHRGDLLLCAAKDSRTPHAGMAVCVVNVVDSVKMTKDHVVKACIDVYPGAWAWLLKDLRWLSKPFPVKGSQGFYNIEIPDGIEIVKPELVWPDENFTIHHCPDYLQKFFKENP